MPVSATMSDPDAFTQKASGAMSAKEVVLSKEETIEVEASQFKGALKTVGEAIGVCALEAEAFPPLLAEAVGVSELEGVGVLELVGVRVPEVD